MTRLPYLGLLIIVSLIFCNCQLKKKTAKSIVVTNSLDFDRVDEIVEVVLNDIGIANQDSLNSLRIIHKENGTEVISQLVDDDQDGSFERILFQPQVKALASNTYQIEKVKSAKKNDSLPACFSRYVPERTDDYAWENNVVAFRTFGPTAQKMMENGIKGGTLSSGIDAWLKRVNYPIINKWYKKELETDGSYHEDTGEGLDNFHVGSSRGVGGTAKQVDSTYAYSKNFISYKTLYNGPLRTRFELTYNSWQAGDTTITEVKKITLDRNSFFSRYDITLKGANTIAAGLTLHEKTGVVGINKKQGWISYWEPHGDSELGTAIVVPNDNIVHIDKYLSKQKDQSNLYANIHNNKGIITYYAGFGWKKSGYFSDNEAWKSYVSRFSELLEKPLVISTK